MRPLAPPVVYCCGLTACLSAFHAAQVPVPPLLELLSAYCWTILVVLWIEADARRRRITPCYDFGFLCGATYPSSLIGYCLASRGWRGLGMLALLAFLWVVPYVVSSIVVAVRLVTA